MRFWFWGVLKVFGASCADSASPQCLRWEEQWRHVPIHCWTGNNLSFSLSLFLPRVRHVTVQSCFFFFLFPQSFFVYLSPSLFILFRSRRGRAIHSHFYGLLSVFELYAYVIHTCCFLLVDVLYSLSYRRLFQICWLLKIFLLPRYLACFYI